MKSTMGDDRPLTVTSILRHGATWHGQREVVTAEDEQSTSRVSYEQIAAGAAQLAHALRALGVDGDDRVGTYLWNNREHLEAYLAVPAMGAVLHTANIRLVTLARPRRGHVGEAALEDALSQGRVLAGVELRLVHPETGALVPHDGRSIGELELRGPWITASYLSGQDPDKFHDGWLRTGDIGTLDPDGYVRLTDRAKDAVKSGGEWISSIGLEAEVAAHPEVIEAAVIGVPDDRWGERPCVVVTLARSGSPVTYLMPPMASPTEPKPARSA
jgi:acyl-CoA synthetase (AMP-forming)/AMP-acid ligase II